MTVVPRNQFSLNDLRRGKVNEVVRPTTQNKLKLSSEPKSTECVVKVVKKDMLAMCRKEKSEDVVKDSLDKSAQPSDIQRAHLKAVVTP